MISKETLKKLSKSQLDLGGVSQEKLLQAMIDQDETLVPNDPISKLVYSIGILDDVYDAESYLNYALMELNHAHKVLTQVIKEKELTDN